ncbi:hypothetical protein RDWZM_000173 [Blomia tropicalis]|uniref:HIT-type domain-containing protein n=1 Tax=Blomia tropicalis TaxID=40697 RepID=A0A9Q0M881_BLOTA|nr:Box C/D snoRNA protein 1 [Blomia tropicalis]KAJ6221628.1 hypothetical protein RDWZM_000173 [Blomia tropicalis]
MASINKNCFGLFGCDTTKSQLKEKDDEIEDGEIVDTLNDTKIDQNEQLQFDKLCSRYELEIARKESMKSKKICFICSVNVSKYTCPKCSIKTCSLNCCLRHKKDYDCDGIRDRLSFVPLRNFSDSNLKSDCKFLEETNEAVNNSNRFFRDKSTRDVTNWTQRFIIEAGKRKIRYRKMPQTFKRAKENKSLFAYKDKLIMWDIEFILPYCISTEQLSSHHVSYNSMIFKRSRISENKSLIEAINEFAFKQPAVNVNQHKQQDSSPTKEQLMAYLENENNIVALFKHDSGKFYYPLDLTKTLLDNFANKTIVEYPTIVVILRQYLSQYPIM